MNFGMNHSPSGSPKSNQNSFQFSPSKTRRSESMEDLQLKLEIDKYNDIRNILYLKNKIITDTKQILPQRKDFKELMREKNEAELLEQQQKIDMDKMVNELERKVSGVQNVDAGRRNKYRDKKFLSSINFAIKGKKKSTLLDWYKVGKDIDLDTFNASKGFNSINDLRNNVSHSTPKEWKMTTSSNDFDTRPRINSQFLKSKRNQAPAEPSAYLIKPSFVKNPSFGSLAMHRKVKSEVPDISSNKEIGTLRFSTTHLPKVSVQDVRNRTEVAQSIKSGNTKIWRKVKRIGHKSNIFF